MMFNIDEDCLSGPSKAPHCHLSHKSCFKFVAKHTSRMGALYMGCTFWKGLYNGTCHLQECNASQLPSGASTCLLHSPSFWLPIGCIVQTRPANAIQSATLNQMRSVTGRPETLKSSAANRIDHSSACSMKFFLRNMVSPPQIPQMAGCTTWCCCIEELSSAK